MSERRNTIFIPKPYKRKERSRRRETRSQSQPLTARTPTQQDTTRRPQEMITEEIQQNPPIFRPPSIHEIMEQNQAQQRLRQVPQPIRQLSMDDADKQPKMVSTGVILSQFKKPKSVLSVNEFSVFSSRSFQNLGTLLMRRQRTPRPARRLRNAPFSKENGKLYRLFLKAFTDQRVSAEDVKLTKTETEILNAFLYRKFFKRIDERDFLGDPETLIQKLGVIVNRSAKRSEECYKYLLAKFFKHIKNEYKETTYNDDKNEEVFYEELFGETAELMGLDIKEFYFPSKSKKIGKKNSLNKDYFARIFKSKALVKKLKDYMRVGLKADHFDDVKGKLDILFDKWTVKFNYSTEGRRVKAILKDISRNKRLKFPWIFSEVEESIQRVEELIETYQGK